MWLESSPSFFCLCSILDRTIRCLQFPASIPLCFLLSSWERYLVPSLLRMLYYSYLGNVHFFPLKGDILYHLLSFPRSPDQRTIFIPMSSHIIYSLIGSPPTPSVSAALRFELHRFFVHILVGDVCRPLSYSLILQSSVLKIFLCTPQWKGRYSPYNSLHIHLTFHAI